MIKYFCDICDAEVPPFSTSFQHVVHNEEGQATVGTAMNFCETHATAVADFIQTQTDA